MSTRASLIFRYIILSYYGDRLSQLVKPKNLLETIINFVRQKKILSNKLKLYNIDLKSIKNKNIIEDLAEKIMPKFSVSKL
jgi:hypothetical protein